LSIITGVMKMNGGEEEEANKHCQIDYLSGDIYSELQEQLHMQMPTCLELSSMMIDFTKSCNYYYCCKDDEWGWWRRRPTNTVKLTIFLVTSYPWQGRYNNGCDVCGVRGALCILHGA